jgi:hypothetical protein
MSRGSLRFLDLTECDIVSVGVCMKVFRLALIGTIFVGCLASEVTAFDPVRDIRRAAEKAAKSAKKAARSTEREIRKGTKSVYNCRVGVCDRVLEDVIDPRESPARHSGCPDPPCHELR